ncbi:HNH endonuclease signature motif containing protein [Isoptericola variabilis]|uniref:HNH endonuclease signature motif containing protein n=1 Tax=Isoptericola variabilis TaxID=139208 RepID=UPI0009DAF544|nr:HNH endonuclease signature motif containing protein [Isoptericola variabilis]
MFEWGDAAHGGSHPARVSRARTGGPGAARAPVVPGPPAPSPVEAALERELARMVDEVFVPDVAWFANGDRARAAVEPAASLAAELDAALPGPGLASRLVALEPADLDDHTLVEVLAAWERVAAWAQAGSARALAELLERTRGSAEHEFTVDGVAARLGMTRHAAAQLVTVAHGTAGLPEVADALATGRIDRRKAETLIATGRLPDDRRRAAVREVLPEAERLTVPQLRERLRRAEIRIDPDGAERRHHAARSERFVRLEPVDDAMAYLTAYLPADDAARVLAAVEQVAVPMHRTPGETRRLDACRADALVGLVTGDLTPTGSVHGSATGPATGRRPGVQVTVAASTLLGADDLPGLLAGHGPVPAAVARALAADPDATWRRILTDPATGVLTDLSSRSYRPSPALRAAVIARDITCTFPGCRVPAWRTDLDHLDPFDPDRDAPQTHGDNLHALCRTHHRAKTLGGWHVTHDPATGTTRWTAPTGHQHDRPPTIADPAHRPPREEGPPGSTAEQQTGPPPF